MVCSIPGRRFEVVPETTGALLPDGDHKGGPRAPTEAMRRCVEHARQHDGMAVAAIRDRQLVVGGPYVRLATDVGLAGLACTNFIPLVAPPGGRTPVVGTNPLAFGLPTRRHAPVVLDMATTTMAPQKVRLAPKPDVPAGGCRVRQCGHPVGRPRGLLRRRVTRTPRHAPGSPQGLRAGTPGGCAQRCVERRPGRAECPTGARGVLPGALDVPEGRFFDLMDTQATKSRREGPRAGSPNSSYQVRRRNLHTATSAVLKAG
jgi:hypothetical protein